MTVNVTLLVVMGVLFAVGVYLLLERSLTRVLLGNARDDEGLGGQEPGESYRWFEDQPR